MTTRIALAAPSFVLLSHLALAPACPALDAIQLIPEEDSMLVRTRVPALDGQKFILLVPKSLGTAEETLMNFPATPVHWTTEDTAGSLVGQYQAAGHFDFEATLTADEASVSMIVTVTNRGGDPLRDVWLFTFLAPHGAPDFHDKMGSRTYFSVAGEAMRVADAAWPESPNPELAAFAAEGREGRLPRQVRELQAQSTTQPDAGWMVAMNPAGDGYAVLASPNPLFLFRNREISSLHVAPLLGDLQPGESGTVEVRAIFGKGDLATGIEAARSTYGDLQEAYCPQLIDGN